MELEEAIETLQVIANKSDEPFKFAIETVLKELKNSIPKKKIEELKNKFKKPDNMDIYYFRYNVIQEELDKLLEVK